MGVEGPGGNLDRGRSEVRGQKKGRCEGRKSQGGISDRGFRRSKVRAGKERKVARGQKRPGGNLG